MHIITTSANHFMQNMKPVGTIEPIRDFENAESFGVVSLENSPGSRSLMPMPVPAAVGVRTAARPINGKPLSPKKMVQDLKTYWLEKGPGRDCGKEGGSRRYGRQSRWKGTPC